MNRLVDLLWPVFSLRYDPGTGPELLSSRQCFLQPGYSQTKRSDLS